MYVGGKYWHAQEKVNLGDVVPTLSENGVKVSLWYY